MCSPEVTVTSLHPPRLCRLAVFSIKPTLLLSHISLTSLSLARTKFTQSPCLLLRDRWCDYQDHEALRISSLRTFRLQNPSLRFRNSYPFGPRFLLLPIGNTQSYRLRQLPLGAGEKVWMTMGIHSRQGIIIESMKPGVAGNRFILTGLRAVWGFCHRVGLSRHDLNGFDSLTRLPQYVAGGFRTPQSKYRLFYRHLAHLARSVAFLARLRLKRRR